MGQEPVLFTGSVKDNITYGLGECSQQQVEEAAHKANAHGFISQLEKGYDTGTLQSRYLSNITRVRVVLLADITKAVVRLQA